jgi:gliding motility-associated-like protein
MKFKNYVLTLFTVFAFSGLIAQVDTVFWFAAPNVSSGLGDSPIEIILVGQDVSSDVTIDMPANGVFAAINLTLVPNSSQTVDLTAFLAQIESPSSDNVNNNGIRIVASNPITASYSINAASNKEIFFLKGREGLGTDFYTPFQKTFDIGVTAPIGKSTIDIVASEDNTTVLITPRTTVVGHAANSTFSVVLNTGQTYTVQDTDGSAATSLSGSIVSSNKKIAVTIAEDAIEQGACLSTIGDQIISTEYLGRKYVVQKSSAASDYFIVMATQNSTSLTVTNSGVANFVLNWGETRVFNSADQLNYIECNKPVYIWHISGNGCEASAAQVPPMICSGDSKMSYHRPSSDAMSLLLYTFAGFENQFTLNGGNTVITAASFQPIPGTGGQYVAATISIPLIDVPANSYFEVENAIAAFGMGVLGEESGGGSYYGYPTIHKSTTFAIIGNDTTICANTELDLTGIVGGGAVTGVWSTNGYGDFANPNTSLINTYIPNPVDSVVSPIRLILKSTGDCPEAADTINLTVSPAPLMSAGVDQSICANNAIVQMDGTAQGGTTTGIWSTLGGGTFDTDTDLDASYTPGDTDISSGNAILILTSTMSGSCAVVKDTMEVDFVAAPEVIIVEDTIKACQNNAAVSLEGTITGPTTTGKWLSNGEGGFSPNNLALNTSYVSTQNDVNSNGFYIYLESTNNGNCSLAQDSVFIDYVEEPDVDAGLNIISCRNVPVVDLAGVVSGITTTGMWSGGSNAFGDANALVTTYTPTNAEINAGNVTLTLTSTNNGLCNANSNTVDINFISVPNANFTNTSVCQGLETDFVDQSTANFGNINFWEWDFITETSSNQNESHLFPSDGTFSIQLVVSTDAGCSDTVVNDIDVYAIPVADFDENLTCNGSQILGEFTDQSTSVDPINYWYYDFGGIGTIAAPNPLQVFPPNGNYSILHIVRTVNGCSDSIQKIISIPELPVAGFSYNNDNSPTAGAEYNFVDTSYNSSVVSWSFDNGPLVFEDNPSNIYLSNGIYYVTQYVENDFGCSDSIQRPIIVDIVTNDISTLIPDAISPNGDGKNDVWKLEFIELLYPKAKIVIYNQWGQLMFESDGYQKPWNGTYKGEPVADGNYFYVIELNDSQEQVFKGVLLILKSR